LIIFLNGLFLLTELCSCRATTVKPWQVRSGQKQKLSRVSTKPVDPSKTGAVMQLWGAWSKDLRYRDVLPNQA
jgi:hypothetical protein